MKKFKDMKIKKHEENFSWLLGIFMLIFIVGYGIVYQIILILQQGK
jgi:hypothetical protein